MPQRLVEHLPAPLAPGYKSLKTAIMSSSDVFSVIKAPLTDSVSGLELFCFLLKFHSFISQTCLSGALHVLGLDTTKKP